MMTFIYLLIILLLIALPTLYVLLYVRQVRVGPRQIDAEELRGK